MSRYPAILGAVALATFFTALPRDARADLIDYGGGMIYDSVQDLTWLDSSFAQPLHTSMPGDPQSCGATPCDWFYTWRGASSWVGDLNYEGYNDWRLPGRLDPSSFGGDNEVHKMVAQLPGWEFGPNFGDSPELLRTGDKGPFRSSPGYYFVWLHEEPYTYTHYMGYDFPDHLDFSGQVRAVRAGRPVSTVPEPSTLGLVALGGIALLGLGRRAVKSRR
ncbi:MAG: PEP-CTERM sorting domain-containing protein [Vicinamibacteraceae bacterium]